MTGITCGKLLVICLCLTNRQQSYLISFQWYECELELEVCVSVAKFKMLTFQFIITYLYYLYTLSCVAGTVWLMSYHSFSYHSNGVAEKQVSVATRLAIYLN